MSPAARRSPRIIVVDDEAYILASVESALRSAGIAEITTLSDSSLLMGELEKDDVAIVLLDLSMPKLSGEELLPRIILEHPDVSIVIVTGNRDLERAIQCIKAGAEDYLVKPVERTRLVATVRRLVELQELRLENAEIRDRLLEGRVRRREAFAALVTADPRMEAIMGYAEAIAPSAQPVLITGETGVGKELFARAIHELSGRKGEFVAVNAAGLDDTFFSDLLFGHRAGAFTGATTNLDGLADRAKDGSLFLDEIGDLGRQSQLKLLRFIETGEYYPLGSDLLRRSRARVIVATNRDLEAGIAAGDFRRDLYFRLRNHRIRIPPLRERRGDLPLLVGHFLELASKELGREVPATPRELFELLGRHGFPGNVRELKALVVDALSTSGPGLLSIEVFREAAGSATPREPGETLAMSFPSTLPSLKEVTELLVDEALRRAGGNQSVAAGLLGVSPQAISKRLKSRPSI
ncbi:MAG TPA: sigma-54 dependent transcriptional regulator [Rectinemataceae bacterium]|nr:sigma-54 dependent transcriptional regulator [Rectinemataceae bacterium]